MGHEQGLSLPLDNLPSPPLLTPPCLAPAEPHIPSQVEIERAVAAACKRVLRDPSQSLAALEARAQGLIALGQVFSAVSRMGAGSPGGGAGPQPLQQQHMPPPPPPPPSPAGAGGPW